tara:strand:- start:1051 stop:1557 length:507 start_codon:yes stop_codon:yes gene_type:complete
MFKIIVAMCKNRGIGNNNSLPWRIKEDLKHFSKITKGNKNNAIIMGKNTWYSLNCKPLPDRDNLVLSNSLTDKNKIDNLHIFNNIDDIVSFCENKFYDDVWVIGGSSIYKQFIDLNMVDECLITNIDKEYDCDTFFPKLDTNWKLDSLKILKTNEPLCIWIHNYKLID